MKDSPSYDIFSPPAYLPQKCKAILNSQSMPKLGKHGEFYPRKQLSDPAPVHVLVCTIS